jgi:hypothetical protein
MYAQRNTQTHTYTHAYIQASKKEFAAADAVYSAIASRVEERALYIITSVMREGCSAVSLVNQRLKYVDKGNWFLRREALRMLTPLAELGDPRALAVVCMYMYVCMYAYIHVCMYAYVCTCVIYLYV